MNEIRTRVRTSFHLSDKVRQAAGCGVCLVPVGRITGLRPHPNTCSTEAQPQQRCLGLQQASSLLVRLAVMVPEIGTPITIPPDTLHFPLSSFKPFSRDES